MTVDLVNYFVLYLYRSENYFKDKLGITSTQLSDFKDVFLLFDKDQDGVLSFLELTYAVKVLGIIMTGTNELI